MDDLKAKAASLGVEVDGRWSEETLKQKIAEAAPPVDLSPAAPEPPREKTLHELNLEARRIDRELRGLNREAGEAARQAVVGVLDGRRPDGKRILKNQRP